MPGPFAAMLPYIAPLVGTGINALLGNAAANKQQRSNMELAKFQAAQNERYLQMQLDYNSPANQMKRFKEAGLNPHLVYGQGNPGNQNAPLQSPDIKPADYQSFMNMLPTFNQTAMTQAQVQATNANTVRTTVLTALNKLQAQVVSRNPLLNDSAFNAIIEGLKSTAQIKAAEAGIKSNMAEWQPVMSQNAAVKMQREIDILDQRFNLNTADQAIKVQILKSKEFQNAISEVQSKWMTDSDITPQHIYQFITSLLLKVAH